MFEWCRDVDVNILGMEPLCKKRIDLVVKETMQINTLDSLWEFI